MIQHTTLSQRSLWQRSPYCWLPLIGYLGLIYAGSAIQNPDVYLPVGMGRFDKLMHATEYFFLPFFTFLAFRWSGFTSLRSAYMGCGIVFGAFYACTDELHQYFIPIRTAEWLDIVADVIGVLAGTLAYIWYRRLTLRAQRVAAR